MITTHAKEWFSTPANWAIMGIFLLFGLSGQHKETILALIIFVFMELVVNRGFWISFPVAMLLSTPGANLFL